MATKIFPSVNDINGGVAGQGKTLTEANLKTWAAMPYYDRPYCKSGAAGSNGGGLNLNIAAGAYMIDGRWVNKDATESVLLTASSTCRVWLQLTVDGSGNVNGTTWVVRTDAVVPPGQAAVLVSVVVTGAATITTITDSFRGVIAPDRVIARAQSTADISGSGTVCLTLTVPGDGLTPIDVEGWGITTNGGAGAITGFKLYDNTAAADIVSSGTQRTRSASSNEPLKSEGQLPAYTGTKSIQMVGASDAGNVVYGAGASQRHFVRARWSF